MCLRPTAAHNNVARVLPRHVHPHRARVRGFAALERAPWADSRRPHRLVCRCFGVQCACAPPSPARHGYRRSPHRLPRSCPRHCMGGRLTTWRSVLQVSMFGGSTRLERDGKGGLASSTVADRWGSGMYSVLCRGRARLLAVPLSCGGCAEHPLPALHTGLHAALQHAIPAHHAS
jgi:hypothetical protein